MTTKAEAVIEYKTVFHERIEELDARVSHYLNQGWMPYRSMFTERMRHRRPWKTTCYCLTLTRNLPVLARPKA